VKKEREEGWIVEEGGYIHAFDVGELVESSLCDRLDSVGDEFTQLVEVKACKILRDHLCLRRKFGRGKGTRRVEG